MTGFWSEIEGAFNKHIYDMEMEKDIDADIYQGFYKAGAAEAVRMMLEEMEQAVNRKSEARAQQVTIDTAGELIEWIKSHTAKEAAKNE